MCNNEQGYYQTGAEVGLSDSSDLLCCPFCGHKPNMSDGDTLHPAGIYWVEDDTIGRAYIGRQHDSFAGNPCIVTGKQIGRAHV